MTDIKQEPKATPAKKTKAPAMAEKFDKSMYFMNREFVQKSYNEKTKKTTSSIVEKEVIRPEYDEHLLKCRIRAAKTFNVSLDHLKEAYVLLNGKKIDGILSNELIDRFGFTDGDMESRVDLATRYKFKNKAYVEIATQKLREILAFKDVKLAYMDYLNMTLTEAKKEVTDDNLNN